MPSSFNPISVSARREIDGSSRSDPDVDEGVGVVRLAPRELTVLHAVKQNHLAADEDPRPRELLGKQTEEWPDVAVDLIAIDWRVRGSPSDPAGPPRSL
jgi:hypothetical protein